MLAPLLRGAVRTGDEPRALALLDLARSRGVELRSAAVRAFALAGGCAPNQQRVKPQTE